MRTPAFSLRVWVWILLTSASLVFGLGALPSAGAADVAGGEVQTLPRPIDSYGDDAVTNLVSKLAGRATAEPFNVAATLIFFLAIAHTFLAPKFLALSHAYQRAFGDLEVPEANSVGELAIARRRDWLQFKAIGCHFLGEVEAVFGIWLIPLGLACIAFKGWESTVHYYNSVNYAEPIFVFVIMTIASSRPILRFAEGSLAVIARIGGGTPAAWWLAVLTIGPLLGSFITEPAAMTICALVLMDQFYICQPSMRLRYATLGLLFVNISVGGTLTHFAAPPVVMVAGKWGWGSDHMFAHFGWKAVTGIVVANLLYFALFARELRTLKAEVAPSSLSQRSVPLGITLVHVFAIAWTVLNAHFPALVIYGLLFFLAFVAATERHQGRIRLRGPMLVGFFLAGLVVHGGFQQWWIAPVLSSLGEWPLMIGATLLTAVNDNAAITYLASLVPDFSEELKYAVVAGAVTGGGLTVIANAPNPAGQSILQNEFGENGVNPLNLFLAAIAPTLIVGGAFMFLP